MRSLAESHGAEVIVRAHFFFAPAANSDVVQVVLFRRSVPRSMRTEEQPCPTCDDQHALGRAGDLGLRLLRSDSGTGAPPLEPLNLISPTFEQGTATPGPSHAPSASLSRRPLYKALGFTSLGLAAGALAVAIGTGAVNGSCTESVMGTCIERLNTVAGIVSGTILAVGFGVTAAILLRLGYRGEPHEHARVWLAPDGTMRF
jgi:hypothetical protein